ncbi:MAG: hypothetical protein ACRD3W_24330, partial [Terriglobales bacterium]
MPQPAKYCRLCRNTTEDLSKQQFNPALDLPESLRSAMVGRNPWGRLMRGVERFQSFSYARKWLPNLENVVEELPIGPLRRRVLEVALEEPDEMKSAPAIDSLIGFQLKPEREVQDLIWRIMVDLTASQREQLNKSKLDMLGMTADKIEEERSLREAE